MLVKTRMTLWMKAKSKLGLRFLLNQLLELRMKLLKKKVIRLIKAIRKAMEQTRYTKHQGHKQDSSLKMENKVLETT